MTLTVTPFGGNMANAASVSLNPGSLVSQPGDRVVVTYTWFDTGTAAVQSGSPVVSTPAKTFSKHTEHVGTGNLGTVGTYSWISDGTTLTQITVTPTVGTAVANVGGVAYVIHSDTGMTVQYDQPFKSTTTDNTSPIQWTGNAVRGPINVAFTGTCIDNGVSGSFTPSSGYTMSFEFTDGSLGLVMHHSYKINESSSPSYSISYSGAITAARSANVGFFEPVVANPFDYRNELSKYGRTPVPKQLYPEPPQSNPSPAPSQFSTSWIFTDPSISFGAAPAPSQFATSWIFTAPVVLVAATPAQFATAWLFTTPTVITGARVNPSQFATLWTFNAPTVIVGASPAPSQFATAWTFQAPTINTGGGAAARPFQAVMNGVPVSPSYRR